MTKDDRTGNQTREHPGDAARADGTPGSPRWVEDVAERTGGIAAAAALGVDARAILDAWGTVLSEVGAQPKAALEATRQFAGALREIWLGGPDRDPAVEAPPPSADPRFAAPEWSESPLFRRVGASYLAWANSLDGWLANSGLAGVDRERARFVLDAAKDVLAPANLLISNPEALRRARETRGASVLQGVRNFVDDLRHNHGYPAVADRQAFALGRDLAATDGAVIFRNEVLELIQYRPTTPQIMALPLVYVFSQFNRFYLGDLTPDRSLFQRLLDAGVPVFAVSWKNPTEAQRHWSLDTYAEAVIEAIRVTREVTAQPQVHLIGVCAGGLVAASAAGVLEARGDDWIDSLSLFINVLDYHTDDSDFGLFVSDRSVEAQKALVRARGVYREKDVFEMFALLRIEENIMSFFRRNYLLGEAPLKHPLLFWSMDYTRVPAEMHCDLLDLSSHNKLAKQQLFLLGRRVDLSKIRYPVYLMAGSTDHITPWKACYRSSQLFSGERVFVLTNQNHTQTICGRLDNRHLKYWVADDLPADPDAALRGATEHAGSWTFHWIDWLTGRSTERIAAPTELGHPDYPVLERAPGFYVRES